MKIEEAKKEGKIVWVKGVYDAEGDIVIKVTDFGGRHIIPKSYHNALLLKEE